MQGRSALQVRRLARGSKGSTLANIKSVLTSLSVPSALDRNSTRCDCLTSHQHRSHVEFFLSPPHQSQPDFFRPSLSFMLSQVGSRSRMPLVDDALLLPDERPQTEFDFGRTWIECRSFRGGCGRPCEVEANVAGGWLRGELPGDRLPDTLDVRLPTAARSLDPSRSLLRSPP